MILHINMILNSHVWMKHQGPVPETLMGKYGKETHVAILKNNDRLTVSAAGYTRLKEVLNL